MFEYAGIQNLIANVLSVYVQEQLKSSKSKPLRWINEYTPWVNRAVAAALAALTTAGVSYQYVASTGDLHVTGLTVENAVKFLTTVGGNYAVQWFLYKATKRV